MEFESNKTAPEIFLTSLPEEFVKREIELLQKLRPAEEINNLRHRFATFAKNGLPCEAKTLIENLDKQAYETLDNDHDFVRATTGIRFLDADLSIMVDRRDNAIAALVVALEMTSHDSESSALIEAQLKTWLLDAAKALPDFDEIFDEKTVSEIMEMDFDNARSNMYSRLAQSGSDADEILAPFFTEL